MERKEILSNYSSTAEVNWPCEISHEQLGRMISLCQIKNMRAVVADEVKAEGIVLRDASESAFSTWKHPKWEMADAYARVGKAIRWADNGLGVWWQEIEEGKLTWGDILERKNLSLLLSDPTGFKILEDLIFKASEDPPVSLVELSGLAAGARRYCQLYKALISAGLKPKELEGERFYSPIAGGAEPLLHRREPIPKEGEYKIVEEIIPGRVVIDERGYYHVFWANSHYYFQDIEGMLRNHDRVIEEFQGTLITIQNDTQRVLEIEGEIPQMTRFANRLSLISSGLRKPSLQTPQTRQKLLGELGQLKDEVGQVRDELKKRGKLALTVALATDKPELAAQKTQEATKDFLERAQDAAVKLEGTIKREQAVIRKRDSWEGIIEDSFKILGIYLLELRERKKPIRRWLESMVEQIVLAEKRSVLNRLQSITGQPYKNRILQSQIRHLADLPQVVDEGNFLRAQRIFEQAILTLKPVIEQKKEREQTRKFAGVVDEVWGGKRPQS